MPSHDELESHMSEQTEVEIGVVPKLSRSGDEAPAWLYDYVVECAAIMGLGGWHLTVQLDDSQGKYAAMCTPIYGRKVATITFDHGSLSNLEPDGHPWSLQWLVAHELLHCHFEPLIHSFYGVGKHVNPSVYVAIEDGFVDCLESTVDAMAGAWRNALPPSPRPPESEQP